MTKLTTAFLARVHAAAKRHSGLQQELGEAMTERYGCTHSDIDCDFLIDTLDQGACDAPTLQEVDEAMAEAGAPKLANGGEHGK